MKKEIETNQENALSLCTEKVLLAQQAYDLVRSFIMLKSHYVMQCDRTISFLFLLWAIFIIKSFYIQIF